jgi:hypothetical protein
LDLSECPVLCIETDVICIPKALGKSFFERDVLKKMHQDTDDTGMGNDQDVLMGAEGKKIFEEVLYAFYIEGILLPVESIYPLLETFISETLRFDDLLKAFPLMASPGFFPQGLRVEGL